MPKEDNELLGCRRVVSIYVVSTSLRPFITLPICAHAWLRQIGPNY